MKSRKIQFIWLFIPFLILSSCTNLDDINSRLDDHDKRLKNLETLVTTANTSIENLQKLVNAQASKITIVSYKALDDKSGYVLEMSDGSKITLKNGSDGEAPLMGMEAIDGVLYWTINGDIIRDAKGNPIKAEGTDGADGMTPKIRVDKDGYWEISMDGGISWQQIKDESGQPVKAVGSDANVDLEITETEDSITISYDGQTFVIPKGQPQKKNKLEMTFLLAAGNDYKLLVSGSKEGKIILDWGNGETEEHMVSTENSTKLFGKTKSQSLTITGDIASIDCSGNVLKALDVTEMETLSMLVSRKNYISKMDLTKNPNLKALIIQDSPLEDLDLSHNNLLDSVICNNNSKMKSCLLPDQSNIVKFVLSSSPRINKLNLEGCANLEFLEITSLMISKLDLSKNKNLNYVFAGLNFMLNEIKLPENNRIETLFIPSTAISSIDLSGSSKIKYFNGDYNSNVTSINVDNLTELEDFSIGGNDIESLDLSHNTKLVRLTCNNNRLTQLSLKNHPKLQNIICYSNELQKIDVANCTALESIDCSNNEVLTEYALPKNLEKLNISGCNQTEIKGLSELTNLVSLICSRNKLTKLDLSNLKNLQTLTCSKNEIADLSSLANHAKLIDVNVSDNPILSLNLTSARDVRYVSISNTKLDACALNDLYTSLRKKRIDDDNNDVGGCILLNKTEFADVSKTIIATDKGWQVSVVGDGTGCIQYDNF